MIKIRVGVQFSVCCECLGIEFLYTIQWVHSYIRKIGFRNLFVHTNDRASSGFSLERLVRKFVWQNIRYFISIRAFVTFSPVFSDRRKSFNDVVSKWHFHCFPFIALLCMPILIPVHEPPVPCFQKHIVMAEKFINPGDFRFWWNCSVLWSGRWLIDQLDGSRANVNLPSIIHI